MSIQGFQIPIAAVLILCGARLGYPIDLTGEWQGHMTCRLFSGGFSTDSLSPSLDITQSGSDLNIRENGALLYNGILMDDPASPERGAVAARQCGIDDTFSSSASMYHLKVISRSSGTATARGWRMGNLNSVTQLCKIRLKRDIATDPSVPACP
jgi:hypothetical protein